MLAFVSILWRCLSQPYIISCTRMQHYHVYIHIPLHYITFSTYTISYNRLCMTCNQQHVTHDVRYDVFYRITPYYVMLYDTITY